MDGYIGKITLKPVISDDVCARQMTRTLFAPTQTTPQTILVAVYHLGNASTGILATSVLADVKKWAKIIASVLVPGGELCFADVHPAFSVLEEYAGRFAPRTIFKRLPTGRCSS